MIITLVNQKGGSGKTTAAVTLAAGWAMQGLDVLLVDADTQGSASTWAEVATERGNDPPQTVTVTEWRLIRDQIPKMATKFDVVIIDTPARLSAPARAALTISDIAILPLVPRGIDAWALGETLEVLEESQAHNPDLVAYVLLNQIARTKLNEATVSELTELESSAVFSVLKTTWAHRVGFSESLTNGAIPIAVDPDSKAASEAAALLDEIEKTKSWRKKQPKKRRKSSARKPSTAASRLS